MNDQHFLPTSVKDMLMNIIHGYNLDLSNYNQSITGIQAQLLELRKNYKKEDIFKTKHMDSIVTVTVLNQMRSMLIVKMISNGYPFYYNTENDIKIIKKIISTININTTGEVQVNFTKPMDLEKFIDEHGSSIHIAK